MLLGYALYDVTDPVHPFLLCKISNSAVHLFTADTFEYLRRTSPTGTEAVLHSIGSGNESVVAGWPLNLFDDGWKGDWAADGNEAAAAVSGTDSNGSATYQIWLFAQGQASMVYGFAVPGTDCICRFGLPGAVLEFSADAQYLVAGWPIGKGAVGLQVIRVSDRQVVATIGTNYTDALWSRTGHLLYLSARSTGGAEVWTPENGQTPLAGTGGWQFDPSLSPDGTQVAYTAYSDPATSTQLRVYVYDTTTQKTRMLVNALRSDAAFVKDGWVWYWEEVPCGSDCPFATQAGTRLFAMQLSTGVEQQVAFRANESPVDLQSGWGPGQHWPNS